MPPPPAPASAAAKPAPLKAMISSTALDLPAHRAAVVKACLAAGVFPIGMEQLPARDATGIQVSLEMVDQADLYIGIYAWRYGWVPKGHNISVTEMEFDRAVERQKDGLLHELLIFTAHDDHAFTKRDIEADVTAQGKLTQFKTKACDGRGRAQFTSAEDLHRLVSEALHHFLKRHREKEETSKAASNATVSHPSALSAPVSVTKVTNNLPRLANFYGRQKELDTIAKALLPQTRTWGVLIDGPGGMGKTSLAVRAAELAFDGKQFDRVLFLTTKSQKLTPDGTVAVSTSIVPAYPDLLNQMGLMLGLPQVAEKAEEERASLIKQTLEYDKALLILDNFENLAKAQQNQLFEFLQDLPPGCKAIVTSRRRSDVEARIIRLEKLEQEAALRYLEELAADRPLLRKARHEDRLHLYEETGGNPLLLRWVVGQLGRGSCRTLANALDLCRKAGASNDPLEFIFGDLLETFTEAETKALAALTYFTQKVEVQHIAEIADLTPIATQTALADLANRALVMPDETEEHFALVPMVADFLRNERPEVVAETGDRLEKHAYALIVENGYQKHDRFPLLDAAWPGVSAAIPRFLGGPNDRLQEVCGALQTFLNFTGRWDERLALCQQAEVRAVAEANTKIAGWRAYQVGVIHSLRGQADAVLDCAERAARYWEQARFAAGGEVRTGIRERAAAVRLRGVGMELKKAYPAAIAAYREALDLHRSFLAESEDVATALNDLADAERSSGDLPAAERDYREALLVALKIGDAEGVAIYTGNLAELALDRKDWASAEARAREALPLAEKIGRQELIARQCQNLARVLYRKGRTTEALPYARRSQEIFARLGMASDAEFFNTASRDTKENARCFYVQSIKLRNVRCFESIDVTLRDEDVISMCNVILGDNAAGKSTLLRSLAIGLCNESDAAALIPGDFLRHGAEEGSIEVTLCDEEETEFISITTYITKQTGAANTTLNIQQTTVSERNFPWKDIFLCGYGTNRGVSGIESHAEYTPRNAVGTLFNDRASLWNPEVALLRQPENLRSDMVRRLMNVLMLDDDSNSILMDQGHPLLCGPWGRSSFQSLSDGYRSTLQWLLDLMAWAILADRFDDMTETRGILLIDELEQHLHPRWQRHVLQRLQKQLPGMQIIATTHTPLIASGIVDVEPSTISRIALSEETRKVELVSLDKEQLRGKRADQILASDAFGLVTTRSPGNTDAVERYTELHAKTRNDDEEAEFEKLENQLNSSLKMGESEYQIIIEEAISETLEKRLNQPPSKPLSFELKRQLRELFGKEYTQ